MDLFNHLALGFGVALTPINLLWALIGALVGTLIGVLPGIGPVATIAMLLPTTYALQPVSALIMLAGIYYGAQYGGSTTSILLNMPGETSSAVTCLDGYQMARKGQAGAALAVAALGSFFAGCVATVFIATVAIPLSELALKFGPAEYCSLMILGLIGAVVLAHGSLLKAIAMVVLGLLLGIVGTDVNSGAARFAFGVPELIDGLGVASVAMGLFGFAEILTNLESTEKREVLTAKIGGLWLTMKQFKEAWPAVLRGTGIGSILGLLPGGGAMLASFGSYALEKKIAKDPSRFGKGAIQGVAGPESANNAGAQTSFIPLLTLGIPENAVMALMVGAMTIHNIQPGPQVMTSNPGLFWGLVVSMWVGNLMLVVLNLPLIGIWIKLLTVPYRVLYPAILLFCAIGVYSISNASFDVSQTAAFGALGLIFFKLECEPAPLILGFVLGPMMEENLRRAMLLSRGDPTVFFTRPISLGMLIAAAALLLLIVAPNFRKKREEAFVEAET
ncbi:MAG: tripartite tricarboxylate transporter permease [Pseudomonadota bacterium]|jgi:TctA family transporter|nr:tripartite tricarboxylate transporter permease [Pseudomonadota bacterium]HEV2038949.1 tripartite tricarboxylate transporter permease [Casimicrobiaceae bacterium]